MIASMKIPKRRPPTPDWHAPFLRLFPEVQRQASYALRNLRGERRQEMLAEVYAGVLCAFVRLFQRGKLDAAHPSVLVRYAGAQAREGRRVGSRLSSRDVLSPYAQARRRFAVERLDRTDRHEEDPWRELLLEDRRSTPADLAGWRIDFDQWLRRLPARARRIALKLAAGDTTGAAARRFGITPGRVSQYRRRLEEDWRQFYGEAATK